MTEKGLLTRAMDGRTHIYSALIQAGVARNAMINRIWSIQHSADLPPNWSCRRWAITGLHLKSEWNKGSDRQARKGTKNILITHHQKPIHMEFSNEIIQVPGNDFGAFPLAGGNCISDYAFLVESDRKIKCPVALCFLFSADVVSCSRFINKDFTPRICGKSTLG